ncbi:MAG TPA: sigma-70 family RNA polymerase sigma factor [Lacipirellulaceae bacterium]|nr:sigma-70 family RNA polymerase sigma factor [Lacipirellulaceae bacterium]
MAPQPMTSEFRSESDDLLDLAKAGSGESLGQLLQIYANYLKLVVVGQLERNVRGRVSPSDVVQETFFEAHRDFPQFRGSTTPEFLAWLRRILVNNLCRVVEQHLLAEKRDVRREISLERLATALEQSAARLEAILPDPGTSPSGTFERRENEIALADQLARLPADYREVIVLRHLESLPFEEIGVRMGRTSGASRMLWLRAVKVLRERLDERGTT